jgi:hypothetical protein
VTLNTCVGIRRDRRMVTFQIELFRHLKHIGWAILDTEPAAFAAFLYDMNITVCDLYFVTI